MNMENIPQLFKAKKRRILDDITLPGTEYHDLSPKGSIDQGIRELIDLINRNDGMVTTSSCSGRVTVFQEGQKTHLQNAKGKKRSANLGGKGNGKWLFVCHNPVINANQNFTRKFELDSHDHNNDDGKTDSYMLDATARYIKIQFEPMILHVMAATLQHAQVVLSAAINAGMRESGLQSVRASSCSFPMVAIRSTGLALSSVIGYVDETNGSKRSLVNEQYLKMMINLMNARFQVNTQRTERFLQAFEQGEKRMHARLSIEGREQRLISKRRAGLADRLSQKQHQHTKEGGDSQLADDELACIFAIANK